MEKRRISHLIFSFNLINKKRFIHVFKIRAILPFMCILGEIDKVSFSRSVPNIMTTLHTHLWPVVGKLTVMALTEIL